MYTDIAAQTNIEPPRVSLLEPVILDCGPPWVFSKHKHKLFLMYGTVVKDDSSDHITHAFPVV
jgi:hypothetical protein